MTKKLSNKTINTFWGLTLRESVTVSIFGASIALSKLLIKIPLKIPGHSGLVWMILLTICCLQFNKGRAGSLAGFISGALVFFLFPGKDGLLTFFKYFLPGLSLDVFLFFLPKIRNKWYLITLASSVSYVTKILVDLVSGLINKIPLPVLIVSLKVFLFNHIIFGFLGGLFGYIIYKKLPKQ